jgi:hypothetical protein
VAESAYLDSFFLLALAKPFATLHGESFRYAAV